MQHLAHLRKNVSIRYAAGIAFINGGTQSQQFRLVDTLFTLQSPQRGAHNLAGILEASAFYTAQDKCIEFRSEIYITSWHERPPLPALPTRGA